MRFDKEASSSSQRLSQFPREDTPLLSNQQKLSSQSKTFANVFIAIVGAGVLGLPYTFKKTGYVMGSLMLFSVSILTYYCMLKLVLTRRKIDESHGYSKITSFGDLGSAVFGRFGRLSVDAMLVLTQAGFCISYLIFISNTLANVFNHSSIKNPWILGLAPKTVYLWLCFTFQLGLNSIPSLTHLAPLSIFADIIDLGAMGVVMVEDVIKFLNHIPSLKAFGGFSEFFYGIGVAVYSFEGVGMIFPLEAEAKEKDKFEKVLGLCMAFISILYGAFGILGYFAFGDETKDIITSNFGPGLVSILVQLGLCINLFFTFPLMMNPVYEVVERRLCGTRYYSVWVRWVVVLAVSLVAVFVPNFADFLSLVGSSVCVVLAIVLPSLFHLKVFKQEMSWSGLVIDGAILVFGLVIAISGTCSSLIEIFGSNHHY